MSENEAGTWQRRPFVISPWKGSVFVGGWLPDHASTPCVKLKPENHEPLQKQMCTEVPDRSFTSVQMVHTHTQLFHIQLLFLSILHHLLRFPPCPLPLQLLFLILGKSWLMGLSGPFIEEVSQNYFVLDLPISTLKEVLQNCFVLTGTLKEV